MIQPRLFLYVQHLLGIGHVRRAALLARAFAAEGFAVDFVSGGMPLPELDIGDAAPHQLPPVRSRDERFDALVDPAGDPVDAEWWQLRRKKLLELFTQARPDVLLIESFPFGRRAFEAELAPILDAAQAAQPRPLIVSSVRDIIQTPRKAGRAEEIVARIRRSFDLVLVHGDPALVRFEESFPLAEALGARLRYTGYVAPPAVGRGPSGPGHGEILVSAGGGAVGGALFEAALGAVGLTLLRGAAWRFLVGASARDGDFEGLMRRAPPGVMIERARPDFARLVANCHISVSQAGYNTVMDILNAQARAVLVPFAGPGETEQSLRAERLAARSLVQLVPENELTPLRLAGAIDAADRASAPAAAPIERNGAAASVQLVRDGLAALHTQQASPAAGTP